MIKGKTATYTQKNKYISAWGKKYDIFGDVFHQGNKVIFILIISELGKRTKDQLKKTQKIVESL